MLYGEKITNRIRTRAKRVFQWYVGSLWNIWWIKEITSTVFSAASMTQGKLWWKEIAMRSLRAPFGNVLRAIMVTLFKKLERSSKKYLTMWKSAFAPYHELCFNLRLEGRKESYSWDTWYHGSFSIAATPALFKQPELWRGSKHGLLGVNATEGCRCLPTAIKIKKCCKHIDDATKSDDQKSVLTPLTACHSMLTCLIP